MKIWLLTGLSLLITASVLALTPAWVGILPRGVFIAWSGLWVFRLIRFVSTNHRLHHAPVAVRCADTIDSRDGLVVGSGFAWTQVHTTHMRRIVRESDALPVWEGERGGTPALHASGSLDERPVRIRWPDLNGHVGIQGATRVGKTEMLRTVVMQLIRQTDGPVVIIDPKGSLSLIKQAVADARNYGRKVALICPMTPHLSTSLDPLSTCQSPVEVAERIRTLFSADRHRPFFVDQPVHSAQLIAHMQQKVGKPWTLKGVYRDVMVASARRQLFMDYLDVLGMDTSAWRGDPPPSIQTILTRVENSDIDDLVMDEVSELMSQPQEKISETHRNFSLALSGLIDTDYAHLFEPSPNALTWRRIVGDKMVVIVLTASLLTRERGNKVGRLLLQDLVGFAGQRYLFAREASLSPITVVCDEFGEVVYDGFLQAVNKLGEAGVRFILAWQSEPDLMGNLTREGALSLLANVGTRITLRVVDKKSAEDASDLFDSVDILETVNASSMGTYDRDGHPVTASRREVLTPTALVTPSWLRALPKGEAFGLFAGAPVKIDGYLLEEPPDEPMVDAGYAELLPVLRELSGREAD